MASWFPASTLEEETRTEVAMVIRLSGPMRMPKTLGSLLDPERQLQWM